jgi:hypothetical protein
MSKEFQDHISQDREGTTLGENRSVSGSLETDRLVESSKEAAAYKGPTPTTAQGGKGQHRRKDKGRLHISRHAVLSRYPLEALQSVGEDVKKYRRLERRFRETLKPIGEIACMLFDRFFSSYLRCVLAARVEANSFARTATSADPSAVIPSLHERHVPTLVLPNGQENISIHAIFPADLFRELVLIQRYDRHFSREMYRALSLLLVLRDGGEDGLQQCIGQILGSGKKQGE